MSKFLLQCTLGVCRGLMSVKRALTFLFSASSWSLESAGRGLVRFLIFPVYKLWLNWGKKIKLSPSSLKKEQSLLYVSLLLLALILAAGETKAFANTKYLNGRQSLLYNYLGPGEGEEEEIFEEGMTAPMMAPAESWQQGFLTPTAGLAEENPPAVAEFANSINGALVSTLPLPGAELGVGRYKIIKFNIQPGDTLGGLAQKFQISQTTILIENKLTARSVLRPGDVLIILPVSGISHKVKKGDTIKKLATLYRVEPQKILDFNRLTDENLLVGEILIIPEGKLPATPATSPTQSSTARPPALRVNQTGLLWPTTSRRITQYFSWRHVGIDIAAPLGTPIYATESGIVETAGWNRGGYGYQIIINHGNNLKSRYAHNSKLFVVVGQRVEKGEVISLMGSTGRSTGPHLHFEIMVGGTRVNPFLYVK